MVCNYSSSLAGEFEMDPGPGGWRQVRPPADQRACGLVAQHGHVKRKQKVTAVEPLSPDGVPGGSYERNRGWSIGKESARSDGAGSGGLGAPIFEPDVHVSPNVSPIFI